MWPASLCLTDATYVPCDQLPRDLGLKWTVHGLWIYSKAWKLPPHERFYEKLKSQHVDMQEMKEHWPDLRKGEDPISSFHRYEWREHGRLSHTHPRSYFSDTIQAARTIDIFKRLQSVDVYPIAGGPLYPLWKVEAAFAQLCHSCVESILCNGEFIKEVRLCLDSDLELASCSQLIWRPSGSCPNDFRYPALPNHIKKTTLY